jgi:hypothetical protein
VVRQAQRLFWAPRSDRFEDSGWSTCRTLHADIQHLLAPGKHKRRKDKEERLAAVREGRVGREEFGSSIARKKRKAGGLSEREKQKRKQLPIAARKQQLKRRFEEERGRRNPKNFKGQRAWNT